MKIINGTVYSKGNPTLNFGYYDPRTKAPYISVLGASQYLISHLSSIPTGFTICVNEDNKPVEYWWDGTAFVLKVNGVTSEELQQAINDIPQPEITFPTILFQTAYISSDVVPQTPIGGNLTTPPLNWSYTIPEYRSEYKIYFSTRNYNSSVTGGGEWSDPLEYLTEQGVLNSIPVITTYSFTIYKVASELPQTPSFPLNNLNSVTLSNDWQFTVPTIIENENYVWVSYATFNKKENIITSVGWTTPVKFVDINAILNKAKTDAETYTSGLIQTINLELNRLSGTTNDLSGTLATLLDLILNGESPSADAQSLINALKAQINNFAYKLKKKYKITSIIVATLDNPNPIMKTTVSQNVYNAFFNGLITNDFAYLKEGELYTYSNFTYKILSDNPTFTFNVSNDEQSFDRILEVAVCDSISGDTRGPLLANNVDSEGNYDNLDIVFFLYAPNPELFVTYAQQLIDASTGAITNLVTDNSSETFQAALLRIMSGKIESDVWSYFENGKTGLTLGCIKATTITQTPEQLVLRAFTGDPTADGDDSDIKSSIVDLIAGKLTLSASSGGNGVVLSLDGATLSASLSARTFTITGDVIAKAIISKELNINNKTYINSDGSLLLAAGELGQSAIRTDGSGYLSGGAISWGSGYVYVNSGGKTVATLKKGDIILVYHSGNEILAKVVVLNTASSNPSINNISDSNIGTENTYLGVTWNSGNNTYIRHLRYNNSNNNSRFETVNGWYNNCITYTVYSGEGLTVSGIINADGGKIANWTIGNSGIYASEGSGDSMKTISVSPSYIGVKVGESNTTNFSWLLLNNGAAMFSNGNVSFDANGSGFIGNNSNNNPTISWTTNGTVSIPVELITGTIVANQVLISKGNINNYAGISGVDVTSDDSKVIWSGGARTGNPTFYVTRDGRIYGKEGTLSVINNNHVTDYSNETSLDGLAGFIEDTNHNAYTSSTPVYKIDPSQLGDVVYLPKNPSATYITFVFPHGLWNGTASDLSIPLNNLRASVGKTIVFVIPYDSREKFKYTGDAVYLEKVTYMGTDGTVSLRKSDDTIYTMDVPRMYEEDLVSFTNMDSAGFLKRLPNSLVYSNPNNVYWFKTSASEASDTRVFTLTVGLGSYNGHEYIYSRLLINDKCRALDDTSS